MIKRMIMSSPSLQKEFSDYKKRFISILRQNKKIDELGGEEDKKIVQEDEKKEKKSD